MSRPDPPPPPPRLFLQAALVFAGCAALYFLTRSPALDEWDSVQFALGVGEFNLWKHQPHPPGYPLYIAAGWLAEHGLRLNVTDALKLVSALGGGLYVACWFALVARRFGQTTGWIVAASLATLLITWMSATKALTDPLATGLLSLTLLLADRCRRATFQNPIPRLAAMGLAGAAAVGARPQNFGVVLLIVCLATAACRPAPTAGGGHPWRWGASLGALLGGCGLWLVPTMWTQSLLPGGNGWLTYGYQLAFQWRWRLDQPKAFVAASSGGDPGENLWLYRLEHHPLGWLTRGFGFALDSPWGWLGIAVLSSGWFLFARAVRRGGEDRPPFWREHLPWAVVYALMIFCFLPGDQRYYLPIFPLLILAAVLGWRSLDGARLPWRACLVPAATLAATLPFIGPNHTAAPPPVQMLRWLEAKYPPTERPRVTLRLRDSRRHADWYARDFNLVAPGDPQIRAVPPAREPADTYTDAPELVALDPPHWKLVQVFHRSPLIYRKHNTCLLYQWQATAP